MNLSVPDQAPVRFSQFLPDDEQTPIELLEEGDYWATESFIEWMRADEQKYELHDLLIERQSDVAREALRKKWQAWVYSQA